MQRSPAIPFRFAFEIFENTWDQYQIRNATTFLKNMHEFKEFNTVYEERFHDHKPARSTIEVASLPLDCRVEIEAIAEFPTNQE